MKKLIEKSYKTLLILLFILLAYITYCAIFNIYQPKEDLKPLVLMIGTIVMIFAFIALKKLISKISESKANIVAIIVCILFFIALVIFGSLVTSIPTADLSNIQREVNIMLQNGGKFDEMLYYSVYPNQIPLTILVYFIYKIGSFFSIENLKIFGMIVNSLFVVITAFLTYLSVKKLSNYKIAIITLIFFAVNPIFYAYSSYFYSDTLCMVFAAVAIYLFILAINAESKKKRILLELISGIVLALGFKIRVVLGILLLGIIISIFVMASKRQNKNKLTDIIFLIVSFIIGIGLCSLIQFSFEAKLDKEKQYPVTHWIMMGLNYEQDGRWNLDDYMYTYGYDTYSDKLQGNIEQITNRLSHLMGGDITSLIKTKLSVNWSNGSYDYISKLLNSEEINSTYEYITGNKKIFFIYYCQICKIVVLLMFIMLVIKEYKSCDKKYSFITISIFGAILFYLIWEVSSRYSLTFLPWMILGFGVGICEFEKILNIKKVEYNIDNIKNKKLNIDRIITIGTRCIFILSIFLIVMNCYKYTGKKVLQWNKVVMQWNTTGGLDLKIANQNIKQTFIANKTFNCISIQFKKQNLKTPTHYNFVLKDKEGNILNKQTFSSNNVENNKLKTFYFNKININKDEEYTIEINSTDATQDNTLQLANFYLEDYSAYPNGTLSIDGKETEADLTFQVQNQVKRPYTSKKVYVVLSITIILIEIFAFYPYLKCTRKNKEKIKA